MLSASFNIKTMNIEPTAITTPKRQRTGWGPLSAIVIALVAYLVSQAALVAAVIPIALVNKNTDLEALFSDSPWINLALTGISSVIMLAVLWMFLRSRKQSFNDLGFRRIKMVEFGWLGLATISYIVLLAVGLTLASNIPGFNADQAQDIGYKRCWLAAWARICRTCCFAATCRRNDVPRLLVQGPRQ
jgi:hypothetical protein